MASGTATPKVSEVEIARYQGGVKNGQLIAARAIHDRIERDRKYHLEYTLIPAATKVADLTLSCPEDTDLNAAQLDYARAKAKMEIYDAILKMLSDDRAMESALKEFFEKLPATSGWREMVTDPLKD